MRVDVDDLQQQLGQAGRRYGGECPQCLLQPGERGRGSGGGSDPFRALALGQPLQHVGHELVHVAGGGQRLAKRIVLTLVEEGPVGQEQQRVEDPTGIRRPLRRGLRRCPVVLGRHSAFPGWRGTVLGRRCLLPGWRGTVLRRRSALVGRPAALVRRPAAADGREVEEGAGPRWGLPAGGQLHRPGAVVTLGVQLAGQEGAYRGQVVRGGRRPRREADRVRGEPGHERRDTGRLVQAPAEIGPAVGARGPAQYAVRRQAGQARLGGRLVARSLRHGEPGAVQSAHGQARCHRQPLQRVHGDLVDRPVGPHAGDGLLGVQHRAPAFPQSQQPGREQRVHVVLPPGAPVAQCRRGQHSVRLAADPQHRQRPATADVLGEMVPDRPPRPGGAGRPDPPGAQVQLGHRGLGEALAQRGPGEQGQRGDGRRLRVARAGTAAQETGVRQAERAGQRVGDLRLPCRRLRVRVRPGVGRGRGPAGPGARGVVGGGTGGQQAEAAAESVAVQQVAQPGGTVRRRVVAHPDDQQLVQVIGAVGEGQLDTHAGLDRLEPVGFPALLCGAEHADRQRVGHRTAELVHRDPAVDQPDETPAPGHRDHPPPVFVRVVGTQRGRRGAGAAGADRPGGACRAQQCEHLLPGFGARTLPVLGARGGLRGGELRVELREQDVVRVDAHPKRARLPPDGLQPHRQERDRGGVVVGEQRGAGGQGLRQFLGGAADGTVQLVGRALRLRLGCLRGGEHVGRGELVAGLDGGLEPPHHGQLLVRAGLRGIRLCACPVQLRAGGERVGHVRGAPVLDTVISRPARWWP
ncbi:UNVERIFIED_CONTAM: hypothetical protein RKD43_005811 [Streptomyces graminofaciens]